VTSSSRRYELGCLFYCLALSEINSSLEYLAVTPYEKSVLVIQHANDEHLGRIAGVLQERGIAFDTIRPDLGESVPRTLGSYGGLIVMGGPQSVCDEDKHPFLKSEKLLTRNAVTSNRPVLGVCLGSQILAEALGARVYAGDSFEIGWKTVVLSPSVKQDRVLGVLPQTITPLHWHGDVFDLPKCALPVGSSDITPVQGFSYQERCYGLLFHIEMTLAQVASMAAAFPEDLSRGGVPKSSILDEAPQHLDELQSPRDEVFRRWISLL